jgi:hypothetical protein
MRKSPWYALKKAAWRAPMTWFVKDESSDGTIDSILCEEAQQVHENLKNQREKGRDSWIEDTGGRRVEEEVFEQPTDGRR